MFYESYRESGGSTDSIIEDRITACNDSISLSNNERIIINNVKFGGLINGAMIYNFDSELIIGIQFLLPQIHFTKKESSDDGVMQLNIKIFNPDNILLSDRSSTAGFTCTGELALSGRNPQLLRAWGNSEGTMFQKHGTYRFEVWHTDKKIYSASFLISRKR